MAREIREFTVTITAGTQQASPSLAALVMPARIVRHIHARIPPGPNGLMGWALASGGVPVIPWNANAWFVANDETFDWDLEGQISSGAWQLRGYNTGRYDHSVYLVFELDPPQLVGTATFTSPIDLSGSEFAAAPAPVDMTGAGGIEPPALPPPPAPVAPPPVAPPPPAPAPVPPPPLEQPPVLPPSVDGYALARQNATVALETALGLPVTAQRANPPALGTAAAAAYDAGRAAAIAAVVAIAP